MPEVEPVFDDLDPGADGEAEDNDAEVVEIKQMVSSDGARPLEPHMYPK